MDACKRQKKLHECGWRERSPTAGLLEAVGTGSVGWIVGSGFGTTPVNLLKRNGGAGGGLEPATSPFIRVARLGFTTYKTAGTAKIRGSRTRHRMLWVGLWVGKRP